MLRRRCFCIWLITRATELRKNIVTETLFSCPVSQPIEKAFRLHDHSAETEYRLKLCGQKFADISETANFFYFPQHRKFLCSQK